MRVLFVCDRLITFIVNEIVELEKLGNDVTAFSTHRDRPMYEAIVRPMLIANRLETKTFVDFNLPKGRWNLLATFIRYLMSDALRYPWRTMRSLALLHEIFPRLKQRAICYIETRPLLAREYEVIHSPFSTPDIIKRVYFLARLLKLPYTLSFRAHDIYRGLEESVKKEQYIRRASRIFLISLYYRERVLSSLSSPMEMDIIHAGVDLDFFKPERIPKRENGLIAVCRFDEFKGIIYLLEACRILQERNFGYQCYLIGSGPQENAYRAFIKEHNLENVTILSFLSRERVREELAKSEIFVLPCIELADGAGDVLPNALKEAMAMELPVITSDIRGIRELVDDGLNGLLVPDKKPVAIADAIERLSRDKALSAIMGRAARKKILSDFNIRREAQKIQTIFQQAVAASSEDRAWVRGNV